MRRTAGNQKPNEEKHFEKAGRLSEKVHAINPNIILQACVFEVVYTRVNTIPVPRYVFTDFDLEPEDRCFCYQDMIFPEKLDGLDEDGFTGHESSIPDISRLESRLWFYYRASRYIDLGYEALHMGQIHLYTAYDAGMAMTWKLFEKIRLYGKQNGRRNKVLLDGHTHGVNIRGNLLFDYHAMPYTRYPIPDIPGEKLVLVREGFSEGGKNVNGWEADAMPYLMEYDNWGGKVVNKFENYTYEQRAWMDWWGYDQIGWFANQPEVDRNDFLVYSWRWTMVNNPNAFFAMPFRRTLGDAAVMMMRGDNGQIRLQNYYQVNRNSAECPMGFGQEDTIKAMMAKNDELRQAAANPSMLLDFGARDVYDHQTGIKLPEKVVVYGSFQPLVGAIENDSNSEITRMYYIGDNEYVLSAVIPLPGKYTVAVSTYGTLSATYSYDSFPRSGSFNKGLFFVPHRNAVIRFHYRFVRNTVTIESIDDTGQVTILPISSYTHNISE